MTKASLSDTPNFIGNLSELLTASIEILLEADRHTIKATLESLDRVTSLLIIGRDMCDRTLQEIESGPEEEEEAGAAS
ncbi:MULTISPECIES: hypothetical protein [unclassified Mesorhizobium]|uniref:hypothetical protein n=1 Tax=unclassified Mesorhizobium TaxID=325217 RepID=UPI00301566AC